MKKIFTILGVSAAMFASAQSNLFTGSDFNDWTAFQSSLGFATNYAEESPAGGVNGTGALKLVNNTTTTNGYVFTANKNVNTVNVNFITVKVKGVSGGVSFNVGNKFFNVPAGTTGDTTLAAATQNAYTGSINANDWITITLDLAGVDFSNATFSMKSQKSSSNALFVDDIQSHAVLAVGDVNATKASLVKNTVVANDLMFAAKANVTIVNMNGQVVKTASVNEGTKLNVSDLAKGMYIVTGTVNGAAVSQKVIKK